MSQLGALILLSLKNKHYIYIKKKWFDEYYPRLHYQQCQRPDEQLFEIWTPLGLLLTKKQPNHES